MLMRPLNRGTSILAALVFAAILGGIAVSIQNIGMVDPRSQGAQAPAATENTNTASSVTDAQKAAADSLAQKCQAAIASAKTAGTTQSASPGNNIQDDCVAAVKTDDPAYKSSGGYKCVGKSATVQVNTDGTLQIKSTPNPNVAPGSCKTIACQPNGALGVSFTATCIAADMSGIDKSKITSGLAGNTAFTAGRGVGVLGLGGDNSLSPMNTLPKSQMDILNTALGNDPNSTSGKIPLDSDSNMTPPATDRLAQIANMTPDKAALDAQQSVQKTICESNPAACGISTAPGTSPLDERGFIDPNNPSKTGEYQGPCPNGQTMNSSTGACSGVSPTGPHQGPCPAAGQVMNPQTGVCGPAGQTGPICQSAPCGPGTTPPPGTFPQPQPSPNGSGNNNGFLQGLMQALSRGLMGQPPPPPPPPPPQQCPSDQSSYSQAQQQYQYQMQQYQYQLQLYQMQQYQQQYGGGLGTGGMYGSLFSQPQQYPPQMPQQCQPTNTSQCQQQIPPPNPALCTAGTWTPQYNGACVTQWLCVPTGMASSTPEAKLSCQPAQADVGMTISITYACANATESEGTGFSTGGKLSGSTTSVAAAPPQNGTFLTYELTCKKESKTVSAQCKVDISRPSIVMVVNPREVANGESASVGWVTSGMKSCTVSSPEMPEFTARNAGNTSVNGMATTDPITAQTTINLKCTTVAGGTKTATANITVK